ncbi:DUF1840 domain-containing protein [Vibrio profundi]|uniref:DUF1840 domain-containing protein n=1 Tax=Vibrio profundi TaxID=1774960 RepID=UPI003735F371
MLITFHCKAHADITMFGDIALHILKILGHSGTVPGAIPAQDLPQALKSLQTAIDTEKNALAAKDNEAFDEDEEENEEIEEIVVGLGNRAFPLISLLKAAIEEECEVMWDDGTNKRL